MLVAMDSKKTEELVRAMDITVDDDVPGLIDDYQARNIIVNIELLHCDIVFIKGKPRLFSVDHVSGYMKLVALKYRFMISADDMNDFMMRAILGDSNVHGAN